MSFCPYKMGVCLLVLVAMVTLPVSGQQSADSHPPTAADTSEQSNNPLFSHNLLNDPDDLKPSASLFRARPMPFFDVLPGSPAPPPVSAAEARQWQRTMDEKKNWTLLTPEEILNLPTEEKIMGLPVPDDQKNLSVEQRYLNRLDDQARALSATNALRQQDATLLGPDANQDLPDGLNQDGHPYGKSNRPLIDIWNKPFVSPYDKRREARQSPIWNNSFAHPQLKKIDPVQEAAMERFRILLGSVTQEKLPEMQSAAPSAVPVSDPYMEVLPSFNPAGSSFTPLRETSSKPIGILPLPGIVTRPITTTKPALYAPKLPPWLSGEMPTPGTQQRVF
jgi:hypothetical protein